MISTAITFVSSEEISQRLLSRSVSATSQLHQSSQIWNKVKTGELAEAFICEFLHLRLPILRFPLGESIETPYHLDGYARDRIGKSHCVMNLVRLEMTFQSLIALGFDKDRFLAKTRKLKRCPQSFHPKTYAGYIDFPRWCIDYNWHVFNARHGGNGDSLDYATLSLTEVLVITPSQEDYCRDQHVV
jgi:hypothetical protein